MDTGYVWVKMVKSAPGTQLVRTKYQWLFDGPTEWKCSRTFFFLRACCKPQVIENTYITRNRDLCKWDTGTLHYPHKNTYHTYDNHMLNFHVVPWGQPPLQLHVTEALHSCWFDGLTWIFRKLIQFLISFQTDYWSQVVHISQPRKEHQKLLR